MDQVVASTPRIDNLFCALELSKNTWLLGIQFPDREQPSVYPIKGGDSEGLMARLLLLQAMVWAAILLSPAAVAQACPTRPVHIIVGFTPGGSTDIAARVVGQWLSERMGWQVVVENRPALAPTSRPRASPAHRRTATLCS